MVAFDVLSQEGSVPAREETPERGAIVRQRGMRLGIAGKVALIKISFGIITAGVVSIFLYHAMLDFVVERQREGQVASMVVAGGRLATQFDSAQRDVLLVLHTPALEGLVRATASGTDPVDDSSITLTRRRAGELFRALLAARPNYTAIQFFDRDGYETVQALRAADGTAMAVPPSSLKTTADQSYFAEAAKLPKDGIYFGDVEPSQVQDHFVQSNVPVARVSAPVYGADNTLIGVVVVSIDARKMFKAVSDVLAAGSRLYIADERGQYLLNPDAAKTFGPGRIQGDFPALTSLIDRSQRSYSGSVRHGGEATLFAASTVSFDPGHPDRRLIIAAQQNETISLSQTVASGQLIGIVFGLVLLMGAITAAILVRVLVVPLRRIRRVAVDLAAGRRDINVSTLASRHDEIGDLATSIDVMARSIAEREDRLTAQAAELKRSNQDLAQFAYVASHDLQEPLRMVGSYLDLLSRRYKGKLDAEADEFIGFAVDGATRMKRLINDLLGYSRAGNTPLKLQKTDVARVLKNVLAGLAPRLKETCGHVEIGPMPSVTADATQLERVFQNLFDNALKYHSDAPPLLRVTAASTQEGWKFSVADNGIGIDPRFNEQIFEIFKRLHGRDQYSGTGIGLAVTKLVVERHGGRIWVEPAEGGGSVFCFTIPEGRRDE